ncbi:MAG: hypothetical protein M1820_007860 [Bogoriella megaspora]|nr:MAG: hypothetical protein M1820_007860 [Bogoriella megaspora]
MQLRFLVLQFLLQIWCGLASTALDCSDVGLQTLANDLEATADQRVQLVSYAEAEICGQQTATSQKRAIHACNIARILFRSPVNSSLIATYIDDTSTNFVNRTEVNWSDACWTNSSCIVSPETPNDVARSLRIITSTNATFAVRSGGHNPNSGFANVGHEGVLIDTVNLNNIVFDNATNTMEIGPGVRFGDVYSKLQGTGKFVNGGKDTSVGIGGYFLGGGNTFFTSRYGVSAAGIKSVEIVLANSTIVEANQSSNRDLMWALKGGGPNFGIVTRYDLETVELPYVWFEARLYNPSSTPALIAAAVRYQAAAEKDPDATLVFQVTPTTTLLGFSYAKPIVRPPIFDEFLSLPYNSTYTNSTVGTASDLAFSYAGTEPLVAQKYMIATTTHVPSLEVYTEGYQRYLNMSTEVAGAFNATLTFGIQPFTSLAATASQRNGGSPMHPPPVSQNWFVATIQWEDPNYNAAALSTVRSLADSIKQSAQRRGLGLSFEFMNDANYKQDVLSSYGNSSAARLRAVSEQVDPQQVFQKLQNGGFKISNAGAR